MDPNEALAKMRAALAKYHAELDADSGDWIGAAQEVAEYAQALDEWLSRDGFLPADWRSDDAKALVTAIDRIVEAWNGGDLAGAVNAARETAHPEETR